jgi:3-dehydroquinate dehydratase/shikimate dehydrogenase
MPTLVCVPVLVADVSSALDAAARAKAAGADLVEFRIDDVFSGSTGKAGEDETRSIISLVTRSPLPCILTCRLASEAGNGGGGGGYDGDEQARVALFERLGALQSPEHPPRYLDVELAAYTRSENIKQKINLAVDHPAQNRDLSTGLILSTHDFDGRPADLTRRIAAMHGQPAAAVHKIAYRARSLRDNLELLDIAADNATPTIALGIGEFGLMSRVLAPKFNAFLTFASLDRTSTTAPGQPTIDDLFNLYRFRSITRTTRVHGVAGWPVDHSLSPLIHNAGFAEIGYDGVYLPLPIPPEYEHFKATILSLIDHPRLDFSGCSVTIPHKENLVRLAREQGWELDELSAICGAANTLVAHPNQRGGFTGTHVLNTDGSAAVDALEAALLALPSPIALADARVGLLGAGGVARAIAAELALRDATVLLYNRTRARAESLARDLAASELLADRIGVAPDPLPRAGDCDAIINCTPIGMPTTTAERGKDGAPFFDPRAVIAAAPRVVMDSVYTPRITPLLSAAREAGIATVDGVEMFLAQAAQQFQAWTGRPAPAETWSRLFT